MQLGITSIGFRLLCSNLRTDFTSPGHKSTKHSHQPLGSRDVGPMFDDGDNDVPIPSKSDDDDGMCVLPVV
jgi:hypothetical protein